MSLVLSVPDGQRQWKLLPDTVLVHRSERSATQPLRLLVVGLEPDRLQLHVRLFGEFVRLDDVVQLLEVAGVERHEGPRSKHRLALVERFARRRVDRQRPEKSSEAFDVAAFLQRLADLSHLLRRKV